MKRLMKLAVVAAVFAYLRDPARRTSAFGRLKALFGQSVGQVGDAVGGRAQGVVQKAKDLRGDGDVDIDDATLAHKVETEIFRDADAPKGTVDVNVQNGVVQLRGEVERPDLVEQLVAKAHAVHGVQDVENLLHLPGEPAPMHQ